MISCMFLCLNKKKSTDTDSDTRENTPLYVPANDKKGIQYMRIDSITVLNDCTFYYEGMAC